MHRYFTFISSGFRHRPPALKKKDVKFIKRLCAGEPTAWVQLVDHWSPYLYTYVTYNVSNETIARRLLHAILSEVIYTLASARRVSNLTVLIFSIAYRHVLHYRRYHHEDDARLPTQRSFSNAGSDDEKLEFLRTFHQFTPEVQQVLLLYYVCGVSLVDLAQVVGQSETLLVKILQRTKLYLN